MVLTNPTPIQLLRAYGTRSEPLLFDALGWRCSEGDRIEIHTSTFTLPILELAGRRLGNESIMQKDGRFSASYSFLIDTWAGQTALKLIDGDYTHTAMLNIRPHQLKMGELDFEAMLDELTRHSSSLIWGLSAGAVSGVLDGRSPAVVHPAIVGAQLPRFERLVHEFCTSPPITSLRSRSARPLDVTRKVDLATMRWLSRRPGLLTTLRGTSTTSPEAIRIPIDQPEMRDSLNHPFTRYLSSLLFRLRTQFATSAAALRTRHGRFKDDLAEAHANSLADDLVAASERIQLLKNRPLLRGVISQPADETTQQLIANHPLFGALHKTAMRMLRPGLVFSGDGEVHSPLKYTHSLFEILVLFRIIDQLLPAVGGEWRQERAETTTGVGRETSLPNSAVWAYNGPKHLRIELRYQQWFSRYRDETTFKLFSSVSATYIPDYIIVLYREATPLKWWILDAKYRSGLQSVNEALGDVHRYRDALEVAGQKASAAYIVVPRLQDEALHYKSETYLHRHKFGALSVFDVDWFAPIARSLRETIYQATE